MNFCFPPLKGPMPRRTYGFARNHENQWRIRVRCPKRFAMTKNNLEMYLECLRDAEKSPFCSKALFRSSKGVRSSYFVTNPMRYRYKLGLNRFLWFWVFSYHPETESWKFWHHLTTKCPQFPDTLYIMGFPWKLPLDDCWIASNLPPETSLKHSKYISKLFSVIAKRLGHVTRVLHWFSWFRANHLLRLGMGPLKPLQGSKPKSRFFFRKKTWLFKSSYLWYQIEFGSRIGFYARTQSVRIT